jgi:SpoVK/Ycf46/Vps4 family AAA+-type ATPase
MENKEYIKILVKEINQQSEKLKEEEKKLSNLQTILRREIIKNLENLSTKSEEELKEIKKLLNEILETLKYDNSLFFQ